MIKKTIKLLVESFPTFAQIYRNTRDLLEQRRQGLKTQWGFTFAGHDSMARGCFEQNETKIVRKILLDIDLLVNIGANVGYYCCHALSMNKPVIAIEPNIRNLHYLIKNIQNNSWANLAEIFPVALGEQTGILEMWGSGTGASLIKGWAAIPKNYVTNIPVLSLDRILGDSLKGKKALILVDIEGAEYMMLRGAKKTLVNDPRPIWMIEITTTDNQPTGTFMNPYFAKTFEIFFALGYRAFKADEIAEEITPQMVQQVATGVRQLDTYNFVFINSNY